MKDFKIWKTITIENKPDLSGITVSPWAQQILDKVKYPVKKQKIDLVRVKVKDLGIKADCPTTKQIYAKAKKLGLELCLPQVGPQLGVDYKDQPLNEWLYIGMKQIADSNGYPRVFSVARFSDGAWLDGDWVSPDDQGGPGDEFVFHSGKSLKLLSS